MILGIGIDMTEIARIRRILDSADGGAPFLERTFTKAELSAAPTELTAQCDYLAARFAAKEAVFKALAPLTAEKGFDLRIAETLTRSDGSPYINVSPEFKAVLKAAGVKKLHLSLTHEGGLAAAFVVAEG